MSEGSAEDERAGGSLSGSGGRRRCPKRLLLAHNQIRAEGAVHLGELLSGECDVLDLSHNELGDEGVNRIVEGLENAREAARPAREKRRKRKREEHEKRKRASDVARGDGARSGSKPDSDDDVDVVKFEELSLKGNADPEGNKISKAAQHIQQGYRVY